MIFKKQASDKGFTVSFIAHLLASALLLSTLTGCIPVIRTEYLSPHWKGTVISDFRAKQGAEILDLTTGYQMITSVDGSFEILPKTQSFDFKLPAASAAQYFVLSFNDGGRTFQIATLGMMTSTQPILVDTKKLMFDFSMRNFHIVTSDQSTGETLILDNDFTAKCGTPLQSAIMLTKVLREIEKVEEQKSQFDGIDLSTLIENQRYWALNGWDYANSVCFKQDYQNSQTLNKFIRTMRENLTQAE